MLVDEAEARRRVHDTEGQVARHAQREPGVEAGVDRHELLPADEVDREHVGEAVAEAELAAASEVATPGRGGGEARAVELELAGPSVARRDEGGDGQEQRGGSGCGSHAIEAVPRDNERLQGDGRGQAQGARSGRGRGGVGGVVEAGGAWA